MEDNPIELEYQLQIILSQRDKQIIIQENKYISYYSVKKYDSKLFRCSVNRNKQICYSYVILDKNNNFNQVDNNLSHTEHDEKINEIQSLKEINTIKEIIQKINDIFTIKPISLNNQITEKLG